MRMAKQGILLLVLLSAPVISWADNHRASDWPEGSAMHTGRTAQAELAVADKELNRVYQALLQSLPKDQSDQYTRRTVVEAQRAWVGYRDATCNLVGELSGAVRMWKSTYSVVCLVGATKKRTEYLKNLTACVESAERCDRLE